RLMTWADPHFIQGYTVGASMLCRAGKYPDLGLGFLLEGERANPDSFEIQTELGHFFLVYKKDYPTAEGHLRRALALMPHRTLSDMEIDARDDAYRWLALTYREWNRPEAALAVARDGLRLLGKDMSLELIVKNRGRRPAG